jgi:hypothetical protein
LSFEEGFKTVFDVSAIHKPTSVARLMRLHPALISQQCDALRRISAIGEQMGGENRSSAYFRHNRIRDFRNSEKDRWSVATSIVDSGISVPVES